MNESSPPGKETEKKQLQRDFWHKARYPWTEGLYRDHGENPMIFTLVLTSTTITTTTTTTAAAAAAAASPPPPTAAATTAAATAATAATATTTATATATAEMTATAAAATATVAAANATSNTSPRKLKVCYHELRKYKREILITNWKIWANILKTCYSFVDIVILAPLQPKSQQTGDFSVFGSLTKQPQTVGIFVVLLIFRIATTRPVK